MWALAALTASVAAYCLARACAAGPRRAADCGAELVEAAMALGMAAMAAPPIAAAAPREAWYAVFGGVLALALVFVVRAGGRLGAWRHHAHHVVESGAMVYAVAAMPVAGMAAMDGMRMDGPSGPAPALVLPLLLYFAGYAAWSGTRVMGAHPRTAPLAGCRTAMAVAMCAMLAAM
ncbi:hypothetical protein BIV57_10170 [Mangrovactinospora gilvigrisea]|uniref:DUF5134 domain-containing protein n=2 Tax=Mangrovactinospora gilvigrisea TaxID=1428644 RepID=A0A1J7BG05_9ACTN|nr:hypothetical protein BIV57_10170 [Mangrovactinospora gilvigrisea]